MNAFSVSCRASSLRHLSAGVALLVLLLSAFLPNTTHAATELSGTYVGPWTSKAFDKSHKGVGRLTIEERTDGTTKLSFNSKIFNKSFSGAATVRRNSSASISITSKPLVRSNSSRVVVGRGQGTVGKRSGKYKMQGRIFDNKAEFTSNFKLVGADRIEVKGIAKMSPANSPDFVFFEYTYIGKRK